MNKLVKYSPAIIFLLLITGAIAAQTSLSSFVKRFSPTTTTFFCRIGETSVPVKVIKYGEITDLVFINLHADEQTSMQAVTPLLEKLGGIFIKIENKGQRNIRFRLRGRYYRFDPNRMFSRVGIVQTLGQLSHINTKAVDEIDRFAHRILSMLPEKKSCIIALHNNTAGHFSVNDYMPGNERETDARMVYTDSLQDPDDIFLTTDSVLYENLAAEKYNTVWQHNELARRDGSLSVYCGEKKISYVNCETEHGKVSQYTTMLSSLAKYIYPGLQQASIFNYTMNWPGDTIDITAIPIYFGEHEVGKIKTIQVAGDTMKTISGELFFNKNFRYYSNMELFFINNTDNNPRIEIRINPNREKRIIMHLSETIHISVPGTAV